MKKDMWLAHPDDAPSINECPLLYVTVRTLKEILGNNNINIADFRLSRGKDGALAVILVDEKVNSDILKKLDNLEAAIAVAYAEI